LLCAHRGLRKRSPRQSTEANFADLIVWFYQQKGTFNRISQPCGLKTWLPKTKSEENYKMQLAELKDLYIDELKDIYSAENQIVKALPKMVKAASSPELKSAFQEHLAQTETQVERLKQIFGKIGEKPTGKVCKGMQGVLEEGSEMIAEDATPEVKDAGLISAAQRVEHYEIAGYGSVVAYAKQLKDDDALELLEATLAEEKQTDKTLSKLATSTINLKAEK
jgi:ferritin-like metal-binding protein YciE